MQENMKKEKILEERNYKLQELKATYEEINSEANDIIHKKETMEKDLQKIMEQISEEKDSKSLVIVANLNIHAYCHYCNNKTFTFFLKCTLAIVMVPTKFFFFILIS